MKNQDLSKSYFSCQAERREAHDDQPINSTTEPTIGDIVESRLGRRELVKGALGLTALGWTEANSFGGLFAGRAEAVGASTFGFSEIMHGVDETHHVAKGYTAEVLIRWGDPIFEGAPAFDPTKQTGKTQEQQFGYNNDYQGFLSLPFGSKNSDHGLLCVNHEYTNEEVMFPTKAESGFASITPSEERTAVEMAANGGSIVEVKKTNGKWQVIRGSYNRRITAKTPMKISGPAAGHARMHTKADPKGELVLGTLNNCAGGMTPWGTYLMAEENFHMYFMGKLPEKHSEQSNYERYDVPVEGYAWGVHEPRFDVSKDPNEPNRFGWIVEVDPLDPSSTPRKLTALGRFSHEGAESIINSDGRVVVYSGDDRRFEYVYRFVSKNRFDPKERSANFKLLDEGTLSVAKFNENGIVDWLPLVFGKGPLTEKNGFKSQADVVIEARRAADLLGATPMDRPEDVEPNPVTQKVYVLLTNNSNRSKDNVNAANPRASNAFGQILELSPPKGDHAADQFKWDILVLCGDPKDRKVGAQWHASTSANGWFACPDNCAIDHTGRLWVSTDQGTSWAKTGTADGIWALETEGPERGKGKMFFRVPIGAEMCGPIFTPDDKNFFVAVQHPATDGTLDYKPFARRSTFEDPATRWPDFKTGMPPRPSVVVIQHEKGGKIGV